jgi:hypothetical protein
MGRADVRPARRHAATRASAASAQRALRDVGELSAEATQEWARQMAEWQRANLDAIRNLQALAFRCATTWPELFRDPIRGHQRSLEDAIDATQRVFELTRRTAETLSQSCQRLERAADHTTRALDDTFREGSIRMQEVNERSSVPARPERRRGEGPATRARHHRRVDRTHRSRRTSQGVAGVSQASVNSSLSSPV